MDRTLRISSAALAAIGAAAAASPVEICGLLLAEGDGLVFARACRNVDPDPARRFELDPAALFAALRAARAGGPRLIGHYHSHPRGPAAPSATDAAMAAADGAVWLIAGEGMVRGWIAVRGGTVHGRFDPVAIIPS